LPNFWGGGGSLLLSILPLFLFPLVFLSGYIFSVLFLNLDVDYCYGWTRRDVPGRRLCGLDKLPIHARIAL
jgi:hypothetical protein